MQAAQQWFRQKSNSLFYSDAGEWQAKAALPVSSVAERPVQQWSYTRFFVVIPMFEHVIDMTSHRVIVRVVPSFFLTLVWSLVCAIAFAGMAVGAGAEWSVGKAYLKDRRRLKVVGLGGFLLNATNRWSILASGLGAGLGFLAAYRMLPVRVWMAHLQDIKAIRYGATSSGGSFWFYLFVFACFYAGGLLAVYDNPSQGQTAAFLGSAD